MAISKVKNKLDELTSGNKTPTSIKNLETSLKNTKKEIENLEKEYQQTIDAISKKQVDLEFAQGLGKTNEVSSIKIEQGNLDAKSLDLATKLENARDKAEQLKKSLQESKLNPNNSTEVQQLSSQLEVMNSKLSQTKEEANQTKNAIQKSFDKRHTIKFGSGIDEIGKKIDKFRKRVTSLMVSAMLFNALSSGLTRLRNGFISLLKTDTTFSNSLNQIKANLMTAFAPIYNACLPAINSLMNALSKITGTIAVFVASLFGTSLQDATKQAKGLSSALEDTSKSGEKASGSLASFDHLEVVNDSSGASGGGGSSGSGIDYNGEIKYSQKLLDFLNAIKDIVSDVINFVIDHKEEILAVLAGIAGGIVALKIINLIKDTEKLTGAIGNIKNVVKALGIGLIIAGIVLLIQDVIKFLKDPTWEGFGRILTDIGIILLGLAITLGSIPLAIAAGIALIVGLVISNWNTICEILGSIGDWIYNNVIKPVSDFCVGLWKAIVEDVSNSWESICTILGVIGEWIYSNVIKPVVDFFVGMWNGLVDGASGAWEGIKGIFSTVATFFGDIFGSAWQKVKDIFSTGGKIFEGIKEGIVDSFKTIVNTIIKGVNKIVATPFNAINGMLNSIRDVGIGPAKPFKGLWKKDPISVPQIPLLAKGTVIPPRQEFMAILGDQRHGTNIEAPLETIKQANREVMQEFIGSLMGLNSNDREIVFKNLTIVAQFGNKDFSKIVVKAVRLAEKELGKQLFVSA